MNNRTRNSMSEYGDAIGSHQSFLETLPANNNEERQGFLQRLAFSRQKIGKIFARIRVLIGFFHEVVSRNGISMGSSSARKKGRERPWKDGKRGGKLREDTTMTTTTTRTMSTGVAVVETRSGGSNCCAKSGGKADQYFCTQPPLASGPYHTVLLT
uniref:Uncharacterized protein n=1 Tax=Vespula pensylvanica TaxID=30213 RepID=A0A834UFQ4_VESPE|nr:hypothetical protein H0235_000021 [Vespula pensylvanica]